MQKRLTDFEQIPIIYRKILIECFPCRTELWAAFLDYYNMRIHRNPHMSIEDWEKYFREVLDTYRVEGAPINISNRKSHATTNGHRVRNMKEEAKPLLLISELIYRLDVSTSRRWYTLCHDITWDRDYPNMAYYQNPYWSSMIKEKETRELLEGELEYAKRH